VASGQLTDLPGPSRWPNEMLRVGALRAAPGRPSIEQAVVTDVMDGWGPAKLCPSRQHISESVTDDKYEGEVM
jgi:hypothetical protein